MTSPARPPHSRVEGYDRDFNPLDPVRSPWADPAFNAVYEPLIVRDFNGELVPYLVAQLYAWR